MFCYLHLTFSLCTSKDLLLKPVVTRTGQREQSTPGTGTGGHEQSLNTVMEAITSGAAFHYHHVLVTQARGSAKTSLQTTASAPAEITHAFLPLQGASALRPGPLGHSPRLHSLTWSFDKGLCSWHYVEAIDTQ